MHGHIYCWHGDGSDGRHVCSVSQATHYFQATMVSNCLRLFAVVIYCCHSDGSDGRHMYTKYHGHTHTIRLLCWINGKQ